MVAETILSAEGTVTAIAFISVCTVMSIAGVEVLIEGRMTGGRIAGIGYSRSSWLLSRSRVVAARGVFGNIFNPVSWFGGEVVNGVEVKSRMKLNL